MRFKLDENLPVTAVEVLRAAGHDAVALLDQVPPGATDAAVSNLVRTEARILVTLDLDFADIRAYPPGEHPGIVVLRPGSGAANEVLRLLERLLRALPEQSPAGRLWVVDRNNIRAHGEAV